MCVSAVYVALCEMDPNKDFILHVSSPLLFFFFFFYFFVLKNYYIVYSNMCVIKIALNNEFDYKVVSKLPVR